MDFLFGTKPKVVQEPNVGLTNNAQNSVQNTLSSIFTSLFPQLAQGFTSGQQAIPGVTGGQFAAPLTDTQNNLINTIVGDAGAVPGSVTSGVINPAENALKQILSGTPQDFSQYFTNNVATPLENIFSERTLPAIKAAFARSAGGTNSVGDNTGYTGAIGQATKDLDQQLQQSATALETAGETQARQLQSQGVTQASGLAQTILGNVFQPLLTALGAAGLPQQTQQTQISGANAQQQQMLQLISQLFGGATGFSVSPTIQQGNTAVLPPTEGLIQSAVDAFAGSAGKSVSDPRLKVIKGEKTPSAVDILKRFKVKEARYVWDPEGSERPMLMADDVEEKMPIAATRVKGVGFIKPLELIPLLVRSVQELSEKAA